MIHEVLAMSSNEMRILFKKKDRISKLLACIRHIETSDDWVPDYDPAGDEGDIQRAHIAFLVNMREQTQYIGVSLQSIKGVFESFKSDIPDSARSSLDNFLALFQRLCVIVDEDTGDKNNDLLADQISRTQDAFAIIFVKFHHIPDEGEELTQDTENVGHDIVYANDQLRYSFQQFAAWIRLDVSILNDTCVRIQKEIDQQITFRTAVENKDFWFSTHDTAYSELTILQR
jgi:hypothetical protein